MKFLLIFVVLTGIYAQNSTTTTTYSLSSSSKAPSTTTSAAGASSNSTGTTKTTATTGSGVSGSSSSSVSGSSSSSSASQASTVSSKNDATTTDPDSLDLTYEKLVTYTTAQKTIFLACCGGTFVLLIALAILSGLSDTIARSKQKAKRTHA